MKEHFAESGHPKRTMPMAHQQTSRQRGSRDRRQRELPLHELGKAVDRARQLFMTFGRTPVHKDEAAIAIGYRDSTGGAAQSMIRTMAYFGLVWRNRHTVTVTPDMAEFVENPNASLRDTARSWVARPRVFGEVLLGMDTTILPSQDLLVHKLIRNGKLLPSKAEMLSEILFKSLAYVASLRHVVIQQTNPQPVNAPDSETYMFKLSGGRRAWIVLPTDRLSRDDKDRIEPRLSISHFSET